MTLRKWQWFVTIKATNWDKTIYRKNTIRLATWKAQGWRTKDYEIILELRQKKIDICGIIKPKNKGIGTHNYEEYLLVYSGTDEKEKANEGLGLLIHMNHQQYFENNIHTSQGFLRVSLKINDKIFNLSLYMLPTLASQECTVKSCIQKRIKPNSTEWSSYNVRRLECMD